MYRESAECAATLEREIQDRKAQLSTLENRLEILREASEDMLRMNGLEGDKSVAGVQWRKRAAGWEITPDFNHETFRAAYPHCYREEIKYKPDVKAIKAKLAELAANNAPAWAGTAPVAEGNKMSFKEEA